MSWLNKVKGLPTIEPMRITMSIKSKTIKPSVLIEGTITIIGGSKKQNSFGVLIHLMSEKSGQGTVSHGNYKVYDSFEINPNEKICIPFEIELPDEDTFNQVGEHTYLMTHIVKWMSLGDRHKQFIQIEK